MYQTVLSGIFRFLKFIYCFIVTFPRDVRGLRILGAVQRKVKLYDKNNTSVLDLFNQKLKEHPNKKCIVFDDQVWTFQDINDYGNKIANVFSDKFNLKKGDKIALFMENKPEFVGIWFGLSKLGVISALINTNLRAKTLAYSIEVAEPKIVIYGDELTEAIEQAKPEFKLKLDFIKQVTGTGSKSSDSPSKEPILENLLSKASKDFVQKENVGGRDVLMYIYTSGTTGLPKPAIIKNNRFITGGFSFFDAAGLTQDDVFLVTLPIYHSNAGVLGIGAALLCGATVVLRKKFSASNFWKDCVKYECTAFSYVGEVCRYLLNQPPSQLDKAHKVRICIGNGMRANIQLEFTKRFGVRVLEIYGATEGNCALANLDGKYGACGFIPIINRFIPVAPNFIIKIDENMNPIRDENGFCIHCGPNEKGLLVGVIGNSARTEYSGYANNDKASNSKIIENLFKPNQRAFNTGDMMVADEYGWVHFVDRLGDTYRWRGENVSTIEMENRISGFLNSIEVVVYGVEIPGQEGKAGMATITSNLTNEEIKILGEKIKAELPAYAKPLFIRLSAKVEHTGSYKVQKSNVVKEGYDVNIVKDKVYYFDIKEQNYKELTPVIYDQIKKGAVRF